MPTEKARIAAGGTNGLRLPGPRVKHRGDKPGEPGIRSQGSIVHGTVQGDQFWGRLFRHGGQPARREGRDCLFGEILLEMLSRRLPFFKQTLRCSRRMPCGEIVFLGVSMFTVLEKDPQTVKWGNPATRFRFYAGIDKGGGAGVNV